MYISNSNMTSFKRFESKPVVKIIFSILFCLVARVVATKKKMDRK